MTGTLTFQLPEEEEQFKDAQNASAIIGGLQEYDNYLRGIIKHEEGHPDSVYKALQDAREKLHECVDGIW